MIEFRLPSCGISISFNGIWSVSKCTEGVDEVLLTEEEISNRDIAAFVSFFPSMWSSACKSATKVNAALLPDAPYNMPFTFPDGLSWTGCYTHVPATRAYGLSMSYADGSNVWTVDGVVELFQYMALRAEDSGAARLIMGALHHNYKAPHFFYMKANKTGQCVKFNYDTKLWEIHYGEPEGIPTVSTVGVTSYISEGDIEPSQSDVNVGMDLLVRAVNLSYSTELLADAPEEIFLYEEDGTPMSAALPPFTNANRLLYFLNADYKLSEKKVEELVMEKAELPMVSYVASADGGIEIATGGRFNLEGGIGNYELYDIVKWLDHEVDRYFDFAARYADATVPHLALQQYDEMFSTPRIDTAPSKPYSKLPVQIDIAPNVYGFDGVRWFLLRGSQVPNTELYRGFRYIDKRVDMTTRDWETLLGTFLDAFVAPQPGLAQLYYMRHDLPAANDAFSGLLSIVDVKTLLGIRFDGSSWTTQENAGYSTDCVMTDFGIAVECSGSGSISSKSLASVLVEVGKQFSNLLEKKYEMREELAAGTAFGTYDLLHSCIPQAMMTMKTSIQRGLVSEITSPVILYYDKDRIVYTPRGWFLSPTNHDKSKKAGTVGDFEVRFDLGTVTWDRDLATFIRDFLNVTTDYTNPAAICARELENAV